MNLPAPTMPSAITGVKPEDLLQPTPTVMPTMPGNMQGGTPIPQGMPNPSAPPGPPPSPYLAEDQGNGTLLIRAANPDGSPGPVVKIVPMGKGKPSNNPSQ